MHGRCPICLDFFVPDNVVAVRCGHTFHQECILRWIQRSETCSTCRYPIRSPNDLIKLNFEFGHNGPVCQEWKDTAKKVFEVSAKIEKLDKDMADMNKRISDIEKHSREVDRELESLKEAVDKVCADKARLLAEQSRLRLRIIALQSGQRPNGNGAQPRPPPVVTRRAITTAPARPGHLGATANGLGNAAALRPGVVNGMGNGQASRAATANGAGGGPGSGSVAARNQAVHPNGAARRFNYARPTAASAANCNRANKGPK